MSDRWKHQVWSIETWLHQVIYYSIGIIYRCLNQFFSLKLLVSYLQKIWSINCSMQNIFGHLVLHTKYAFSHGICKLLPKYLQFLIKQKIIGRKGFLSSYHENTSCCNKNRWNDEANILVMGPFHVCKLCSTLIVLLLLPYILWDPLNKFWNGLLGHF